LELLWFELLELWEDWWLLELDCCSECWSLELELDDEELEWPFGSDRLVKGLRNYILQIKIDEYTWNLDFVF
jgi:hypothetical protein